MNPRVAVFEREKLGDGIIEFGEKKGLVAIEKALDEAKEKNLDLVQVSSLESSPVVCKLLDYGKHVFEKKKKTSSSKSKVKKTTVKEIKFRPGTEENDYQIKLKSISRFILDGDKAKITMRFKGREISHQEFGMQMLERIRTDLEGDAVVEQMPKLEGRQLVMVLAPKKK